MIKDDCGYQLLFVDLIVVYFEKGFEVFYVKKWVQVCKFFEVVIVECEQFELIFCVWFYVQVCDECEEGDGIGVEDLFFEVVMVKNFGDFEMVIEICKNGGCVGKDEKFVYFFVFFVVFGGELEEVMMLFEKVIEMNLENWIYVYYDSDFEVLCEFEIFQVFYEFEFEEEEFEVVVEQWLGVCYELSCCYFGCWLGYVDVF